MQTHPRSLLFVPGDNPQRIAKAAHSVADAVIVDLEDAVLPDNKAVARAGLAEAASLLRENGKYAVVRINSGNDIDTQDLTAALDQAFDAIMVPKVDDRRQLEKVNRAIAARGNMDAANSVALIALIESARGVLAAPDIAAFPRVFGLALGTEDFALSMGVKPDPGILDLPVRTVALAAHANGKAAYAMPLSIGAFRDSEATETAAKTARGYGCHGALCIHPAQAEILNAAFAPTGEEVAEAQDVLRAWRQAQAEGRGVGVAAGRMVDAPVVAWARTCLFRAGIIETEKEAS